MYLKEVDIYIKEFIEFMNDFRGLFGIREQIHWHHNLLIDEKLKSIQPLSERSPGENERAIQQFVDQNPRKREPILKRFMDRIKQTFTLNKGVLGLDDTSLSKKLPVGLGQRCGVLEKASNCQSIVTGHLAIKDNYFSLYTQLYLLKSWFRDPVRCKKVGVPPKYHVFRKKWEIVIRLLQKVNPYWSYNVTTFDTRYGGYRKFLNALDEKKNYCIEQKPESHSFRAVEKTLYIHQPKIECSRNYLTVSNKKACAPMMAKKWQELLSKMLKVPVLYILSQSSLKVHSRNRWVSLTALSGFLVISIFAMKPVVGMNMLEYSSEDTSRPAKNIHPLPLTQSLLLKDIQQERKVLMDKIIKVTNAEYDWPCHIKTALKQILPPLPSTNFEEQLHKIFEMIKVPESLLSFLPGENQSILYSEKIFPHHKIFSGFEALFIQIDQILDSLDSILKADMNKLKAFYITFINSLCEANVEKKTILLSPKVLLRGEIPFGFYRISQETARQLISKNNYGFTDRKNYRGSRAVQSLSGVHFKFLDASLEASRPGVEYMTYAFAQALSPQFLITPSVILKLDHVFFLVPEERFSPQLNTTKREGNNLDEDLIEHHFSEGGWQSHIQFNDCSFFVQASLTIGEKSLEEVLEKIPRFQGDPVNMGWQLLLALLTDPGDGKEDNYSVQEGVEPGKGQDIVIAIDNDNNFFYSPLHQCENYCHLHSGINCIFYLLDSLMDQTLPDQVIETFLALPPSLFILKWLGYLQDQNFRYQQLIYQGILNQEDLNTLELPIKLSLGLAEQVMTHMIHLQTKLREDKTSSPHYLLESLYPTVANYYQKLRECYKYKPLEAMLDVYKSYDQRHDDREDNLKTVDKVLNLSTDDDIWKQAQKNRVNSLNDDLLSCVKSFVSHIPDEDFEANLNELLFLTRYHFKELEDDFFKNLRVLI